MLVTQNESQHMRDESEKALEEFRMEQAKKLNELTKQVSEVQRVHKQLTEKVSFNISDLGFCLELKFPFLNE